MPHPIQIPRLGWSMEQGTFVGWLKISGDNVQPGEPLFMLEGEKAIQEIEAVDAGTLQFDATNPAEGDIVAVGAVIGYLLAVGETAPTTPRADRKHSSDRPDVGVRTTFARADPAIAQTRERNIATSAPPASPAVRRLARQLGVELSPFGTVGRISEADVCRRFLQLRGDLRPDVADSSPLSQVAPAGRGEVVPRRSRELPTISPRAARAAAQIGIDWTQLRGTGFQGRIRERDVLGFAGSTIPLPSATPAATRAIPITPLRRTIAKRMVISLQQTAPVTLTTEIDVTALIQFREQFKNSNETPVPSITDVFAKLTALALREHPTLNARWRNDAIELLDDIHIGIAVETEAGLLVPVVRNANRQSVFEIAHQSRELIEKARSRRLTTADLQGGTFTITNLGSLGIDAFTPIINFPETAILGLGRVRAQPADSAHPRHHITLSLTFDHRVLDGAPAGRFLRSLSQLAAAVPKSLIDSPSHR